MATVSSAWGEKHEHIHLGEWKKKGISRIIQPEDILVPKLTHLIMFYRDWIGQFRFSDNKAKRLYKHFLKESGIADKEQVKSITDKLSEGLKKLYPNKEKNIKYVNELYAERDKEPLIWNLDEPERDYKNSSFLFITGVKRIFELLLKQYHLVCWTALNEEAEKIWDRLVIKKKYYNSFKFGKIYIAMSNEMFDIWNDKKKEFL